MQDFKSLRVWQRAQTLTVSVYRATDAMTDVHAAGLRAQMRRAAASIAANIAEGTAQSTPRQFGRYLQMSVASATELRSHLDLARRLRLIREEVWRILDVESHELIRMLVVLTKQVRARV